MEGQMDGRTSGSDARARRRTASPTLLIAVSHWRSLLAVCVIALLLVPIFAAVATTYIYDQNGRLVIVASDLGESAHYLYDKLGNLETVSRYVSSELIIVRALPYRGARGELVKLQGNGFSPAIADNLVYFNGVQAVVESASRNELVVVVPNTATTGQISISVGASTAYSPQDFIVIENPEAPHVVSFSPEVVAWGDAVTVSGTSFHPSPGLTTLRVNDRTIPFQSISDTSITFVVPAYTGSGRVSVVTPLGTGVSSENLITFTGRDPSHVVDSKKLAFDNALHNFAATATDDFAVLLFDGDFYQHVSVQFDLTNQSPVNLVLYNPLGWYMGTKTVSASAPSYHLPRLTFKGTYALLMTPTQWPTSWRAGVQRDDFSLEDAALSFETLVPRQSRRLAFNSKTAANTGTGVTNLSLPGVTKVRVDSYTQGGSSNGYSTCYKSDPGCGINTRTPTNGSYSFIVNSLLENSTMSFQARVSADVTRNIAIDQDEALTLAKRGQNGRLIFNGNAGQTFMLWVSSQSTTPSSNYVYYYVYKPNGSLLKSGNGKSAPFGLTIPSLPETGAYTIFVDPNFGVTANMVVRLDSTP